MTERNQPEPPIVASKNAPRGCILGIERQTAHEDFLAGNNLADCVILKMNHAQRLVRQGETAESFYGPDVTVITTSTIHDTILRDWTWEKERDVVLAFQPDFHVPTDHPVYWGYTPSQRKKNTRETVKGLLWMIGELRGSGIRVIPLLKGTTVTERVMCYKVFQDLGVDYCAIYGTQYFTSGKGFEKLLRDVRKIVSEAPVLDLFVIGCLAPRYIERLPPQVVTASGLHQWRTAVKLREVSNARSQELFQEFKSQVQDGFEVGQFPLGIWTEEALMEERVHG